MNDKERLSIIQFTVSTVAYIIVFAAICVSVGFAKNVIMVLNGVFFIIYVLSLWHTGMSTFAFYESSFFVVDMLSFAVYANIPYIFIRKSSNKSFVLHSLLLITINEVICIGWDTICHRKAKERGKWFHLKWSLYTALGVLILIVSMVLIRFTQVFNNEGYLLMLDFFCIGVESVLLLIWRMSEYRIKKMQKH